VAFFALLADSVVRLSDGVPPLLECVTFVFYDRVCEELTPPTLAVMAAAVVVMVVVVVVATFEAVSIRLL